MNKTFAPMASAVLILIAATGTGLAQSSGASPADPNNERNQQMAPGNIQPSDPAADRNPGARVPTDPVERDAARREEGGSTGNGRDTEFRGDDPGLETGTIPAPN
jgi:hypothetical protein